MRNTGLPQLLEIVKGVPAKLRGCVHLFTRARETNRARSPVNRARSTVTSSRVRFWSVRRRRDFRYLYIAGEANLRLMGAC